MNMRMGAYTEVYSVIYDSGSVPEKSIFSPRGTSPVHAVLRMGAVAWRGSGSCTRPVTVCHVWMDPAANVSARGTQRGPSAGRARPGKTL